MPKKFWLLLIGMAINITGSSLVWPLNTIFLHNHLGASLTFSGLILMFYSAAGIIGNLVGGTLYDRAGGYPTIVMGVTVAFIATLLMTFFHAIWSYTVLLIIVGIGSGLIFPPMYAMAGANWPGGGRKPFNALYVSQNLGVALGASLGGYLSSFSFTLTFLCNAIMYAVFLVLVLFFYKRLDLTTLKERTVVTNVLEQKKTIRVKASFYSLLWICLAYLLGWIAYVQWQSTIASYTQQLGISLSKYSLLWTVNGFLIVVGQPVFKFVTARLSSLKAQIAAGFTFFVGSYVFLLFSNQFSGILIAMVVLTIGEMFVWPAIPTIASELAPKSRTGFYQGFVNSTATAGRMFGPFVGGVIVDLFNIKLLFIVLLFVFLLAGLIALFYDVPIKMANKAGAEKQLKVGKNLTQ